LIRHECRELLLYAIQKCKAKFGFKLYALCIMSNHIHYLLEPLAVNDLPKIMHWLNWYTAMCFNRMLNRTGHFWEKRYHSSAFAMSDKQRALNTLRYIHANPKAAGMQQGFFYDFSNYGSYERLTDDGLTQWHPAFMALGKSLDICAAIYRNFCKKYRPKSKPERKNYWGSKLLEKFKPQTTDRRKKRKSSPGQMHLWEDSEEKNPEIKAVAEKFILANCFDPIAKAQNYREQDNKPRNIHDDEGNR
jgi:putative transposase